jgi:hypothetical protein
MVDGFEKKVRYNIPILWALPLTQTFPYSAFFFFPFYIVLFL